RHRPGDRRGDRRHHRGAEKARPVDPALGAECRLRRNRFRPRLHAGERSDPLGRDHGRTCRKRGSAAQLPDAVSKTGELMTSVTPTEQAGSVMAAEGDRSGVTILKLRYALEDKPGAVATALFGVQHVLVMFTGMIAAPLVVGQLLDLPPELRTNLLTGVMLGCVSGQPCRRSGSALSARGCQSYSAPI